MNKPLILVVEDDIPVRNLITITLKTHGYRYLTAGTGDGAVVEASSHNPDVVLLDQVRIFRITSTPSISGSPRSSRIISGFWEAVARTPASPFAAVWNR